MRTPDGRRRADPGILVVAAAVLGLAVAMPGALHGREDSVAARPGSAPKPSKELAAARRAHEVDSISAVLGRRIDAPLVHKPFQGGARSLDELGRTVCWVLHHRAADSLYKLCINEEEMRDLLWPEMPQSKGTGLTAADAWEFVYMRLKSGTSDAIGEFGGRHYEFLRWERNGTLKPYRNFKVHNGMVLVARRDDGDTLKMHWLRAVAERKGRFKIQSVRD